MINQLDILHLKNQFESNTQHPFSHVVIDDFFDLETAQNIADSFFTHDDSSWTVAYDNPVEKKKACSHWDKFPPSIYSALFYLCSAEFIRQLSEITSNEFIVADYGLHGGGMHSHNAGGKLNIHKDYYLHPKLTYQRNYNLIIYMTPEWNNNWGGGLEFWSHDDANGQPAERVSYIENKFNRAVLFDTTQNSWHGLPEPLSCPPNKARQSLATYYLSPIKENAEDRKRALYAPYKDQKNDPEIVNFCKKRSGL
jgi:Rps23 Pro-64 3,4-dihydroxylase Tpa1-like proline 4-hydroxylase